MTDQPPTEFPPLPEYAGNPFIERLGPIRTLKGVQDSLNRPPLLMDYDRHRPPEERMHAVLRLLRFSQATVTAREVGLKVDQMIRQGYVGRNPCTTEWYQYAQSCADLERGLVEETRMPPMVIEGAIDRAVLDQLLEGFGVPRAERDAFAFPWRQ